LTERVILQSERLGGLNFRKDGEPAFQAVDPESAKRAIAVIDQDVLVERVAVSHTSMLVLRPG